jgi:hypothetical protein
MAWFCYAYFGQLADKSKNEDDQNIQTSRVKSLDNVDDESERVERVLS